MSQNITLLGASYSDVPAVELPKTGGGTATFTDVSDTTATAADALSGTYLYLADGTMAEGTIANGTITNNTSGGTSSGTINRGSQIKIGSGYYASDAYYTAQSNSGTKTINSAGTISVDGYANISLAAGAVKSGSASISSVSFAYQSSGDNFKATGTGNVGAPSINNAGYISSTYGQRIAYINGASLSATVAKIVGSTTISGDTTKKPSIAKQSTPSGVTNAASGDATTTAPSSGVYVAVKSAANTGTLTATPSVTTSGYGTSANNGITGNTATVGASASDTTYVPITTATPAFEGGTLSSKAASITVNGTVSTSSSVNNSGISLTPGASAVRDAVTYDGAVSGWVSKSDGDSALAAASSESWDGTELYLNGVTLETPESGTRSFGITVPNGESTITFVFTVDSSGNVTVAES